MRALRNRVMTGGECVDPGFFYTPTLLTDFDPDSEVPRDEVFGPVLAVIAFDDDDAVRIANNSIYGLAGAVFSRDENRAISVARRIRSGSFAINGGNYFLPAAPLAASDSRASVGRWVLPGSKSFWSSRRLQNVSDAVKLAAIRDALDRAGLSARTAVSVAIAPQP